VADALRVVLEDPALEVIEWEPGLQPGDGPRTGSSPGLPGTARLSLPVTASSGEQFAVIRADPSLSASDDLLRAAIAATSFALENARLETALAEQLQEVRESRLRIIQAGMAERRRIERDLHDGIQGRLIALDILLSATEGDAAVSGTGTTVKRVRDELALVISDLREMVHGIHPATLSRVGLDESVRTLAERYTIPIDVDMPPGRFGEAGELTAYYVISESVVNAVKYAKARRISVRGDKSDGFLKITVVDDGCGGARIDAGTGIRGIFDRVQGIGGDAELDSPPGRGTRVQAVIPCA
jgi:signal transduction histidine kinase